MASKSKVLAEQPVSVKAKADFGKQDILVGQFVFPLHNLLGLQPFLPKVVTVEQTASLMAMGMSECCSSLTKYLQLTEGSLRSQACLSTYLASLEFSKRLKFAPVQVATIFAYVGWLLGEITKSTDVTKFLERSRDMLMIVSSTRADNTPALFGEYELQCVIGYLEKTVFQHYRLLRRTLSMKMNE